MEREHSTKITTEKPEKQCSLQRALSGFPLRKEATDAQFGMMSKRVFDRDDLMRRIGCDEDVLEDILQGFIDDYTVHLEKLQQALSDRNNDSTYRLVHLMKGAAANMSANPLRELVSKMETLLQKGDISQAASLLQQIRKEFDEFKAYVTKAA